MIAKELIDLADFLAHANRASLYIFLKYILKQSQCLKAIAAVIVKRRFYSSEYRICFRRLHTNGKQK